MFKDIVPDIRPLDVLVSTNVVVEKGKVDAFDCELVIVTNDGHRVIRYFGFTLDNTEFSHDKRIMYDIDNDRDYVTELEYENGVTGYTQYRRATEAERMVVHDLVYRNKGLIRNLAYRHGMDIPQKILDVSSEYDRAMVITFPDYILKEEDKTDITEAFLAKFGLNVENDFYRFITLSEENLGYNFVELEYSCCEMKVSKGFHNEVKGFSTVITEYRGFIYSQSDFLTILRLCEIDAEFIKEPEQ